MLTNREYAKIYGVPEIVESKEVEDCLAFVIEFNDDKGHLQDLWYGVPVLSDETFGPDVKKEEESEKERNLRKYMGQGFAFENPSDEGDEDDDDGDE